MSRQLSASLVIYDIPDNARTPEGDRVPNPSPRLQLVGVRVNLSCWIIPNHLIPYTLLHELSECGATWHAVKFDVSEAPKLIAMAENALRADIRAAVDRAVLAARVAGSRMDCESPEDALVKYERSIRAIIKRANALAKRLEVAAEAFGIDPERIQLGHAAMCLGAIRTGAETKARIFAQAIRDMRHASSDCEALVDGSSDRTVHVGIMADAMDDAGLDTAALRTAFREEIYGAYAFAESAADADD